MVRIGTLRGQRLRVFCLALSLLLLGGMLLPGEPTLHNQALAQGPCTVTNLDPHSAPNGSVTGFTFTVTDNNDSIAWIKVTSPSANLQIVGGSSDWLPNVVYTSSYAYFYGDAIAPSNPIQVSVSASVSLFPSSSWTVQASLASDGSNPMTCSGDTSVSVTDTTPPNILTISAVAQTTTATISWTTDKSTNGSVDYGTTTAYGHTVSVSNFATAQSVQLTGLTPSTVYHYQITVVDEASNTTQSNDSTFLTATPAVTNSGGSTSSNKTPAVKDTTPPTISITSKLPKVFAAPPSISGVAADNIQVAQIEYSTDGGQNWLPTNVTAGLGTKHATFTFQPINLDDGTYTFMARAIDGGGNIATTPGFTVVIDRLPPVVGGNIIALGPQVLVPNDQGEIDTLAGVSLNFYTSATGGPTSIDITAKSNIPSMSGPSPNFSLQQAADTGLWSGVLSFAQPGTYTLTAHSVDGANHQTTQTVGSVNVGQASRVLSANGPISGAMVTAYYRDPDSGEWILWDGLPFGQTNPQTTDAHGTFRMFLPPGTYYLHVSALGYADLNTDSFSVSQSTPLSTVLHLASSFGVGPVRLPWLSFTVQPLENLTAAKTASNVSPVGKPLGNLILTDTSGNTQNSINWLGKPTLVTVLSTWAPATAEQIGTLSRLASNPDVNIEVIGLQENGARLRAYDAIADSQLVWLADPDSRSVPILNPTSLPMHFFVDRHGIVQSVQYGVLSYQQILNTFTNLP